MSRFSLRTLPVTLACVSSALAGLYGTSPVANTVWTAGRSESVTWIDDKFHPHLDQLGPLNIALYSGTDVWCFLIALYVRYSRNPCSLGLHYDSGGRH